MTAFIVQKKDLTSTIFENYPRTEHTESSFSQASKLKLWKTVIIFMKC